jgi:hypothetical protein
MLSSRWVPYDETTARKQSFRKGFTKDWHGSGSGIEEGGLLAVTGSLAITMVSKTKKPLVMVAVSDSKRRKC